MNQDHASDYDIIIKKVSAAYRSGITVIETNVVPIIIYHGMLQSETYCMYQDSLSILHGSIGHQSLVGSEKHFSCIVQIKTVFKLQSVHYQQVLQIDRLTYSSSIGNGYSIWYLHHYLVGSPAELYIE